MNKVEQILREIKKYHIRSLPLALQNRIDEALALLEAEPQKQKDCAGCKNEYETRPCLFGSCDELPPQECLNFSHYQPASPPKAEVGDFTDKNRAGILRDKPYLEDEKNQNASAFRVMAIEALEHLGEGCKIIDSQVEQIKQLTEKLEEKVCANCHYINDDELIKIWKSYRRKMKD